MLDVEGCSCADRGEEGQIIERQLACLALCVSDTFIVNLMVNQVGQTTTGLLGSIMEAKADISNSRQEEDQNLVILLRDFSVNRGPTLESCKSEIGKHLKNISLKYETLVHIENAGF